MKSLGAVSVCAVFALSLAACGGGGGGGGGGSSTVPPGGGTTGPFAGLPAPGAARTITGTRTISTTGIATVPGWPGAGTYAVTGTDQELAPPSGAPSGTAVVRYSTRSFSGAAPVNGVLPQSETRDDDLALGSGGIVLVARTDTTVGRDITAERNAAAPVTETATTATTYPANTIVVPSAIPQPPGAGTQLSPAATLHLLDHEAAANGGVLRDLDYTRTTNADGSFDETGTDEGTTSHALHQAADGTSSLHDQLPGFFLRDVAVAAPSATGTLAVTTRTQGRAVGPSPPVVTSSYTTPLWFNPQNIARVMRQVYGGGPYPPECNQPSSSHSAFFIMTTHETVDVAAGLDTASETDEYLDGTGTMFCRTTSVTANAVDVTTGAGTASYSDRTTEYVVSSSSAPSVGVSTSRRRGTR